MSIGVGPIIAGNIVDVEVDPETGKIDILRCTALLDVGTPVHPSYVEGQIQGGTVQGIGAGGVCDIDDGDDVGLDATDLRWTRKTGQLVKWESCS